VMEAQRRADQILTQARADAEATRADVDGYVLETLQQLQDHIAKLSNQVSNGMRVLQDEQSKKSGFTEKAETKS